jgi:hypothetical protein
VRLAHAECAGSQVLEADAGTFDLASLGGMLSKAAVLQYASPPPVRPLLILEPRTGLAERTRSGEHVNLLIAGLLDAGFTLLRIGGQFPAPAPGWQLRLGAGAARLTTPDGTVAYVGSLDAPGMSRMLS